MGAAAYDLMIGVACEITCRDRLSIESGNLCKSIIIELQSTTTNICKRRTLMYVNQYQEHQYMVSLASGGKRKNWQTRLELGRNCSSYACMYVCILCKLNFSDYIINDFTFSKLCKETPLHLWTPRGVLVR